MGTSNNQKLNMKILVIGTNGFLGGWVKKLLNLESQNYDFFEIPGKDVCDITDHSSIDGMIKEVSPEIVINCAAFVGGISYGYKYPVEMLSKNSEMAINVYKASKNNQVKKLINPISNCAYPAQFTTYKEKDIFNGPPDESVFNYALSKRLFVKLGQSYFDQYNFSSVNVVLSNMYGPNDHFDIERSHALGALVKKICDAKINNLKTVEIWGTGKPMREWLYVEDGAKSLIKSINISDGHHLFNVGVEKVISIKELAEIIKLEVGWEGEFKYNQSKPDGVLEKKVDGSKGKEILQWEVSTELTTGIRNTVDWYNNNYKKYE